MIAGKEGSAHPYRRIDVQKAVFLRYNCKWHLVGDNADLGVWIALLGSEAIYGLRLSDQSMRRRGYKSGHLPASLTRSAAAAIVQLSDPQPCDVFLDPVCSAGTTLAERAFMGTCGSLLGGDIRAQAVQVCKANVGPGQRDATVLPLPDGSPDKVVSNLPVGRQMGSHAENRSLHHAFFREMSRIVRLARRLAIIAGECSLTGDILSSSPAYVAREQLDIIC